MCAVAARGLFRGLVSDDLAAHGIGFSLFDMPALAALSTRIVVEEQAARRPMTVVIAARRRRGGRRDRFGRSPTLAEPVVEVVILPSVESSSRSEAPVRFAAVPAGA